MKRCAYYNCRTEIPSRHKWCDVHRIKVRQKQLKAASSKHQWRKRRGLAPKQPKLMHAGKPTSWALKHVKTALKLAKKRGYSPEELPLV